MAQQVQPPPAMPGTHMGDPGSWLKPGPGMAVWPSGGVSPWMNDTSVSLSLK